MRYLVRSAKARKDKFNIRLISTPKNCSHRPNRVDIPLIESKWSDDGDVIQSAIVIFVGWQIMSMQVALQWFAVNPLSEDHLRVARVDSIANKRSPDLLRKWQRIGDTRQDIR